MVHPWSCSSVLFWDDTLDYSHEDIPGPCVPSTACASAPIQTETGRLFGTINNLLSRLGPLMNACTSSYNCPTFSLETPDGFTSPYDSTDSDDPTDEITDDLILESRKQTFRNDDDENIDMKLEDHFYELDACPTYRSGRSCPTPPLGTRLSLACMPTLGERIAFLQTHLLPTSASSPLTTRRPPAPASHPYSTPDPPTDLSSSPPLTTQEVHHAKNKRHCRPSDPSASRDRQKSKTEYLSPAAQRRLWRSAGPSARSRRTSTNTSTTTAVQTDPFLQTLPPSSTSFPTVVNSPLRVATPSCYEIVLTPPLNSYELPMPMPIKLTIDTRSPRKTSQTSSSTPSPLKGPSLSRKRRREEGQYPALLFMP